MQRVIHGSMSISPPLRLLCTHQQLLHIVYEYYSEIKFQTTAPYASENINEYYKQATELRLNRERDIVGTVNCIAKSQQGCDDVCVAFIRGLIVK